MSDAQITITVDGPYLVSGEVPIEVERIGQNAEGGSWTYEAVKPIAAGAKYALCRCGESRTKPFCDGTHARIGFDGTEVASRAPHREQAAVLDGRAEQLEDAEALCAFARFCDNAGSIWALIAQTDDAAKAKIVRHEAHSCPSGRLVLRNKATGKTDEPHLAKSIALIEDPEKNASGPIYVRGGIPIASLDGTPYEVRNRVALCRCGASQNKPFCDGSHVDAAFRDGLGGLD
jgi:CDGSH-type Zn-finger protein